MRSIILTIFLLSLAISTAPAAILSGNANVLLGVRVMSDDGFDTVDVDQQPLAGINIDIELPIIFHIEFGFLSSTESGTNGIENSEITFTDVFVGLNKTFNIGPAHPFFGFGVTTRIVDFDQGAAQDSNTDLGGYIHAGAFWRIGDHFNIGLDARYIAGPDMDYLNSDIDVNNVVAAVILGYGW